MRQFKYARWWATRFAAAYPELPCTSHDLKKGEIDYGDLCSDCDLPGADDCERVVNESICDAYESVAGIDKEQMNHESDAYGFESRPFRK